MPGYIFTYLCLLSPSMQTITFQEQDQQECNFFSFERFFACELISIPEPTYRWALLLNVHVSFKYFSGQIILCAVDLPNFVKCEGLIQDYSGLSKMFCFMHAEKVAVTHFPFSLVLTLC